jgi:ubiquinone/menaquinone biosynthesis C-methylase UbiE
MTTDYDAIADEYRRAKLQPWREEVEASTLLELVGDVSGKSVLDLACGEGYYTRRVKDRGAGRVVGVDLSRGMIDLARAEEARSPRGIEYLVGDAGKLSVGVEFDLVVAAYLLNYSRSERELGAMCDAVARRLSPGGRFVTINMNPWLDYHAAPSYRAYGFETRTDGKPGPGSPLTWVFHLEDQSIEVENYLLDGEVYERALRAAGFGEVRWIQPRVSSVGRSKFPEDYWTTLLESPPVIAIECLQLTM